MTLRNHLLIALLAAVLCVLSPWAIPIGSVPITLATLGVYLAAGLLGSKGGAAAVALYLAMGLVGVPVFSGFAGGLAPLTGITGGYLWGYLPCAALAGWLARRKDTLLPLGFAVGTVALYTVGTAWFMWQTHTPVGAALLTCVLPFLPADGAKIALATVLTRSLLPHLHQKERHN